MIFGDFKGDKLSLLGFGTMRLPTLADGSIDQKQVEAMTDYAIANGVNYFDTAWPYHSGLSEVSIGKALARYPRESFNLASKFPGHQISESYDPEALFEMQLKKCGVDHFDFYLLHNVYENSIQTYLDPRWKIFEYFREQKKNGRIRHLGLSSHAQIRGLTEILDILGDDMEFCQIQLNYLDWTLQNAKARYELLAGRNIPVWVMEPVRGGMLASRKPDEEAAMKALRPDASIASWSFSWLMRLPGVSMILSGMSNMEQMKDNVDTFNRGCALTDEETALVYRIADGMHDSIPCTGCRYCCDGCPQQIDIPFMMEAANELRFEPESSVRMRMEAIDESRRPSACIDCGQCSSMCPQRIDVPAIMHELAENVTKLPDWAETCREREKNQKMGI